MKEKNSLSGVLLFLKAQLINKGEKKKNNKEKLGKNSGKTLTDMLKLVGQIQNDVCFFCKSN